jgi:ABC-type Mn2+/Zn2+ transport system permease subunit
MSDTLVIIVTAGLVATAAGLLGPFLVLRRVALMSDAVSHAVLPGIVAVFLIAHTRAPLPVIAGAAVFAVICVLEGRRGDRARLPRAVRPRRARRDEVRQRRASRPRLDDLR